MDFICKDYAYENGKEIELEKLKADFVEKEDYIKAHKNLPIPCHDVFIKYHGGIILVKRKIFPAKDIFWGLGGRIQRGVLLEESLKQKIKQECGLDLKNIQILGFGRHLFETEPFGHGKGTDTPCLVFFAEGIGELKLDNLHENPEIITKEKYTEEFKEKLHPYIKDFMDIVVKEFL